MNGDAMTGLISCATPVLVDHEGERLKVYMDSEGIPTIGVGLALMEEGANRRLVQSEYAKSLCRRCGVNYTEIMTGCQDLTQEQSRAILNLCIIDVVEDLTEIFNVFWTYTQPRQIALVDMRFNLGPTRFRGFHKMIGYILEGNWAGAATEALHSEAAAILPRRYDYDAGLLGTG